MSSPPISLSFIERIRQTQYTLQCEWSMNRVETTYRKQQYDRMLSSFVDCLALQKRHYMLVYQILNLLRSPNRPLPPYWTSILATVPAEVSEAPYPPIERIFQKLPRCRDPEVIDALTFCGIPPYFSFFMTSFGIRAFLDLLEPFQEQPSLYDCYARMAFASPLFISFASDVFQPILSPLLPDRPIPPFEGLSRRIQERWKRALPTMPPVVSRLLESASDPERTLSNSFFDVALDCQRAKVFGLVDYSRDLTEELVILLRALLTIESKFNILGALVSLTTSGVACRFALFTDSDRQTVPALFQPVLLSTFDFNAWAAVQLPGSQFVQPSVYEVRAYLHTGEEETFCIHNANEATMAVDHFRVDAALRHLLQDADPIPRFKSLPRKLSIKDFFVDFLLRRGPRETFARRYDNLTTIQWKSGLFSDESKILAALSHTPLTRKKEIRALSAFTALWDTFVQANKETQLARDAIQEVFYSLPVFRWCRKYVTTPFPLYVRNPGALNADLRSLLEKWNIEPLFSTSQSEIIYSFLSREISFEAFRKTMPQIRRLDEELNTLFSQNADALCNDMFPFTPVKGQWNKNQWLRERLNDLKTQTEYFDRVCFAATESAPICKLREFGRAFGMVRRSFVENCPPSKELGEDELLPALIGFVILANPPGLVSNLVFICEFCGSPRYDRLFHQHLVQPVSVLRMTCRYLRDPQILVDLGYLSVTEAQM
jgi:hypothetical protein